MGEDFAKDVSQKTRCKYTDLKSLFGVKNVLRNDSGKSL